MSSPHPNSSESEALIRTPLIDHDRQQMGIHPEELLHSISSFWVMIKPVALTMILSSLAVVTIRDQTNSADELSSYLVYRDNSYNGRADEGGSQLGEAIINAVVIVCFVMLATFVIVACYKFNCMKFLVGYMLFASVTLLGFMGGSLTYSALAELNIPIDYITFVFASYNFAFVGVISIFYQKGINMCITQCYLVVTSIIMAWHLSKFPEWTTWALLVMLALYDLCAVLTPCGPLKCLINLVEKEKRPLPGLLYEADVPYLDEHKERQRVLKVSSIQRTTYQQESASDTASITVAVTDTKIAYYQTSDPPTTLTSSAVENTPIVSRQWLTEFYQTHNPALVPQVDSILLKYRGNERDLLNRLHEKYLHSDVEIDRTIKLGLGDFIFYSVLVSRAATYHFSTMAGCLMSILAGLGATLLGLAAFEKALPALPISIFLGVCCYFTMRVFFIPFTALLNDFPLLL